MIGQTISHYRILEKLGEGGMGIVYKAHDTKLDRDVALKFLPHHLTATADEQARFLQEARAAAALNHPNICTIYDIAENEGEQFIAMEYIDGNTLRHQLETLNLKLETVVSYAVQIGEALQEAHSKGIVHRDVKTDNIMVNSRNQIKVMDFGLAKLKGSLKLTKTSSTVGTLAYMAPEQIQGGEVDARSDIFSFGVVLYETLTGHTPFRGEHEAAMLYSIVNEEPESLQKYLLDAPSELLHVLNRALEKDPEDRYQSVHDMVIDLRRLKKETTRVSRQPTEDVHAESKHTETRQRDMKKRAMFGVGAIVGLVLLVLLGWFLFQQLSGSSESVPIAVISFENQTGDASYDYLREAIPSLLTTSLEQSRYVRVMSSDRMRDLLRQMGKQDVKVIDREMGFELCQRDSIRALVIGSFVKAGETFATDVKIVDVRTKQVLKSASSQGEGVASILKSQIDELSRKISSGIGIGEPAARSEQRSIKDVTTTSMDAYRYYLKGGEEFSKQYFGEALGFYKKALESDSTFALAHLMLARTHVSRGEGTLAQSAFKKAMAYSENIPRKEKLRIEIDYARDIEGNEEKYISTLTQYVNEFPKEKWGRTRLANFYHYNKRDYNAAIDQYNRVLELDPKYGQAWNNLGYVYSLVGNHEKAIECFNNYANLSPGNADPLDSMADGYFLMGRFDLAISRFSEAGNLNANYDANWKIAYIDAFQEKFAESFKALLTPMRSTNSERETARRHWWRAFYHFWLGNTSKALGSLRQTSEIARSGRNELWAFWGKYLGGWCYLERGMTGDARREFGQAFDVIKSSFPGFDPAAWNNVVQANVLMKENKIDSGFIALKALDRLTPNQESSPDHMVTFWRNLVLGELWLASDSCDKVVRLWEGAQPWIVNPIGYQGIELYNPPFPIDVLARAYVRKGEIDKAIVEYQRLTTTDPAKKRERRLVHPLYHHRLAKLYEQKGWKEKAIMEYEKFLALWKDADLGRPEPKDARVRLAQLIKVRAK
jgi:serine/threonine protein kinase/tetratricopeptide (TPR) repeat protein